MLQGSRVIATTFTCNPLRMKRLKKLIHRGEGEQLDFKQTVSDPFKIAKTITSFANTRGGTLLIGVRDDKTIRGVDPEEEKYVLETAATFHCEPAILLTYREVEDQEEEAIILEVTIAESQHKPHYVVDKYNQRHVYIRQHDKSLPASKVMIDMMRQGKLPTGMGDRAVQHLSHNEKKLFSFLENHHRITLRQFMQMVNISKRRALRTLHELTLRGMIRQHDHEKEAYYTR